MRRGMTLLEVIVALTVAGVALAAGAAVLGFLTDQQMRSSSASFAQSVSARDALRDWLRGAQLGTAGDINFVGARSNEPGKRPMSSVIFVTTAATPVAGGGDARTRVHLVVSESRNGAQLVAELSALPAGPTLVLPVAEGVTGFDIRYRATISRNAAWLDRWVSTSVLPAIAEVRIIGTHDALLDVPITVLIGERH